MIGRSILKWIILASNIVAVFFLIMTLIGTFINPDKLFFAAYFALFFPIIVIVNIAFVVFWLMVRKWLFILSLAFLLMASSEIGDVYPLHFSKKEEVKISKKITLLTYNTMGMGKLVEHTKKTPNKVIQYIIEQDADIVCLQEYSVSDLDQYLSTKDVYRIFDKYPYKHIYLISSGKHTRHNGMATFSKFPIVDKQYVDYTSNFNSSIYTDIKIGDDTIRIVNNHLESNKVTEQDKVLPLKLKENFDTENLSDITRHFSRKLGVAYKIRAKQADAVAKVIKSSPYKTIVCGDFNDVPASYAYTKIRGDLKDAFSEIGSGFGFTFQDKWYFFRIDYILYDANAFTVSSFKTDKVKYSDHFPVSCTIGCLSETQKKE